VQICFLALFKEKVNKLLDQVNSSRISGIWQGNLVSGRILEIQKGRPVHPYYKYNSFSRGTGTLEFLSFGKVYIY
jgi:hypothetical protein